LQHGCDLASHAIVRFTRTAVIVAAAGTLCSCAESWAEPRCWTTGVSQELEVSRGAMSGGEPSVQRTATQESPAQGAPEGQVQAVAPRMGSISLGYIGDNPVGTEPSPPYREPYWVRPFPCDWTNTCWMMPTPDYQPMPAQ
jgi:hypothetical protein